MSYSETILPEFEQEMANTRKVLKRMIGILFTQRIMDSPEPPKVFADFWTLAYGAVE